MKKFFVIVFSGCILLMALGAFIALGGQQVPASASQPIEQEEMVVLPAVLDPTVVPEKVTETETIIKEFQARREFLNEAFLQEGWLHYSSLIQNNVASQGSLPNGAVIPKNYILDDWYLLDQDRQVTSAVSFIRDEQGNIVQTSVLHEGNWYNLTLQDISPAMPFTPKLDNGFFERAALHPTGLSKATAVLDSGEAIAYVLPIYLEAPVTVAGSNTASTGTVEKIYFDPDTGALLKMELFTISENGVEVLDYVTTVIECEHQSEPSAEVAKILEEVTK